MAKGWTTKQSYSVKDGSLYISHAKLSDHGEYTVMVTTDDDASSNYKAYMHCSSG